MINPKELNIVTVIQARLGSTRLPGKIMLPLLGKPALIRMIERVQRAQWVGQVVVATTTQATDNLLVDLCQTEGILHFRGHPTDLLDRHYQLGKQYQADVVVKIPSDVTLIDPQIIDRVLSIYRQQPIYDYLSNLHPSTYPDGNDVEVMSFAALETAWHEAKRDFEREHTTPFLWENPERFRIENVTWETGLNYAMTHRWVLDYAADYALIKAIFETLYPQNPTFSLPDILNLLQDQPQLREMNAQYVGVNWYRHHLAALTTITAEETCSVTSDAD